MGSALPELFSQREDVTFANPFGPPARGWNQVDKTLERASAQLREGSKAIGFERISEYATVDLAYTVPIRAPLHRHRQQHSAGRVGRR